MSQEAVNLDVPDEWRGIRIVPDPRYRAPIEFVPIGRVIRSDLLVPWRTRRVRQGMQKPGPTFMAVAVCPPARTPGSDDINPNPMRSTVVRWQVGDRRIWDGNHRRAWAARHGFQTLPVQVWSRA